MKLGTSVKILGKKYRVQGCPRMFNEMPATGSCAPWLSLIKIDTIGMSQEQRRDALLHEIFHGIFSEAALTIEFKDDDEEEKIVRRMATGCLQVLRENAWVVRYLTEKST